MSGTQAITTRHERDTLEAILKRPAYLDRFKQVLGERGMQFCSSILSVGRTMPDVEPKSIVASAMIAATLDLPIEKNLGFAWLVPYNTKEGKFCQFQMGYKGYIQLALRTGRYERMNARPVNREALGGFDEVGEPVILWDKIDETKPAVGYAFGFKLTGGFTKVCYWPKEKVQDHAKRYSQSFRSGRGGPWETHFNQMALKTVISNELSDWGILSIQWQQARTFDQAVVTEIGGEASYVDNTPEAITDAPRPAPTPLQQAQSPPPAAAPQNVVPMQKEPPPAETPAKRGPGRPPKAKAAPEKEKFTAKEAAELRAQGETVDPSAVEGEETPETTPQVTPQVEKPEDRGEGDLAAMGLAPEEPSEKETEPAKEEPPVEPAAPTRPPFQPIAGEPEPVTNLRRLMYDKNVDEAQLFRFLEANPGIARGEKALKDFVQGGRAEKLKQIATAFTNPLFLGKLEEFREKA